jgi:hypothetical protein
MDDNVHAPGMWKCMKCGFGLTKNILCMGSGTIHADNEPFMERCPNDGAIMAPVTWKELSKSNYEGALRFADERNDAVNALEALYRKFIEKATEGEETEDAIAFVEKLQAGPPFQSAWYSIMYSAYLVLKKHRRV